MNPLFLRLTSVRLRLTLWNTLTFTIVLLALGIVFRFLAENSLLHALDREIKIQGTQFLESQSVEEATEDIPPQFVKRYRSGTSTKWIVNIPRGFQGPHAPAGSKHNALPQEEVSIRSRATNSRAREGDTTGQHRNLITVFRDTAVSVPPANMPLASGSDRRYRIVHKQDVPMPDQTGAFLYRAVSLEGDVLEMPGRHDTPDEVAPWDRPAFRRAMQGQENFVTISLDGSRWRVLSMPLQKEGRIVGALQIASPLNQVYRDIAGLTRTLLLILPLALLVAAVAGVFTTGRALLPVKALSHAASRIGPEQLSQRLPLRAADEFDALASTFNRALDRVEQAFEERENALEQMQRFTADASHELRTPLTTIKVNTGVALAETEPSQEHLHALRQIDSAADRMTALVQGLLLLARSDAGQTVLDRHPVLLETMLSEVIETLAPKPQVPIVLDMCASSLIVQGDCGSLSRLFLNLLENAIRYTPAEGEIRILLERLDDRAVVRVRDTGCGIEAVHLPHLGERFYRADTGRNRRQGGSGLGLAICRTILAQHRGDLTIESAPGCGTTVTVSLPLL